MKHLLLAISLLFVGSVSAQTLLGVDANIKFPTNGTAMDGVNPIVKTTACGPDTNGYALAKAS